MGKAIIDDNNQPAMIVLLDSDGLTPIALQADPTSHALEIDDNTSGSDNGGGTNAKRDINNFPVAMAMSSAGDGTRVALYATSGGSLLINSN